MFDIVINNGIVLDPVDGERCLHLGLDGAAIAAVSEQRLQGKKEMDAAGRYVAPGFIDIHMHTYPFGGEDKYEILNYLALMGVTTAVDGSCGLGDPNLANSEQAVATGVPVNYTSLAGHLFLRLEAGCDDLHRPASNTELAVMKEALKRSLESGAPGLSFGLEYIPGTSLQELLTLSETAAAYPNRLVSAHYRYDADRSPEAMAEMIRAAREAKVKFQVSHIGSGMAFNKMTECLKMLESAHASGVDIMADLYPYHSFMTAVGTEVFAPGCLERWSAGYEDLLVVDGQYKGRRCTREIFEYLRENEADSLIVAFVLNEPEIVEAMRHPLVMIASDGMYTDGQGHPRGAGTFPRVLGKYTRNEGILDLAAAIHKISLMPALRMGLETKGRIKEGYDADITIFDPKTVIDCSTYEEPARAPLGIESVLVEGVEVVWKGKLTGARPGRLLKNVRGNLK